MERLFFSLGSLMAALAVAAGAYAAHGAALLGEEQAGWLAKAARYQMYHAFGLLVVAGAVSRWPQQATMLQAAGWLFLAGILLFCGSLYLLAFILGWLVLAVGVWIKKP